MAAVDYFNDLLQVLVPKPLKVASLTPTMAHSQHQHFEPIQDFG